MAERLTHNMTAQTPDGFGYDPHAEWEHSEGWIHDQTPDSHFGTGIQKTRRRDQASLAEAMSKGYTKEDPGPGGRFDYPEAWQKTLDSQSPDNLENLRKASEDAWIEGTERAKSWALQHTTKNTAHPGGYELNRWAHTPDREPGLGPPEGRTKESIFIETPGISPKWNDPMLGPGQIPPGEPGANHEFLPEETEAEYIGRVVWPMYGGPEQIAWEDLPGVHAWGSGKSPWYDPRVPWPSNVPRSPDDRLHTSRDYDDTLGNYGRSGYGEYERYGKGPASNVELPPLPEGVHRRSQPQPILRQERGMPQFRPDMFQRDREGEKRWSRQQKLREGLIE